MVVVVRFLRCVVCCVASPLAPLSPVRVQLVAVHAVPHVAVRKENAPRPREEEGEQTNDKAGVGVDRWMGPGGVGPGGVWRGGWR